MKKVLFALVAMSLLFTACEDGNDDYIKLKEVDDVCTMMDDLELMEHCYEEYDVNKDGKVSMSEAAAVTEIDTYVDRSIKGLEYFINLTDIEILFYEGCTMNLDFRPFKNLKSLDLYHYNGMSEDPIKINLSNNKALEILKISGFTFPQLDLSKLTNLQELELFANISEKLDLSKLSNLKNIFIKKNISVNWGSLSECVYLSLGEEASNGLNISNCTKLEYLSYHINGGDKNNPVNIDLSNNKALKELHLTGASTGTFISKLDLSQHLQFSRISFKDVLFSWVYIDNGNKLYISLDYDFPNYTAMTNDDTNDDSFFMGICINNEQRYDYEVYFDPDQWSSVSYDNHKNIGELHSAAYQNNNQYIEFGFGVR